MFNNLVESNKHTEDFKRKGSFFLATIIAYSLFLVSAGVASVLAYDTHLENQSLELVALLSPVQVNNPEPEKQSESKPTRSSEPKPATRTDFIARIDNPKAPEKVSSTASTTPPVPRGGNVIIGPTNTDVEVGLPSGIPNGDLNNNNTTGKNTPLVIDEQPPPSVKKDPVISKPPTMVSKGVITGQAIHLQKPAYPVIARNARVSGEVKLQVVVDESGKVISATVISGHPLLRAAASQAAMQTRFTPTKLSGAPVKVTGIINYNFTL